MSTFTVTRLLHFTKMLEQIEADFPGAKGRVALAEKYLEEKAEKCGTSTNREQRYVLTRATPPFPGFVIFFHVDMEKMNVNLTTISERPKGANGDDDEDEA